LVKSNAFVTGKASCRDVCGPLEADGLHGRFSSHFQPVAIAQAIFFFLPSSV
jgi:hypothetical protein